MTSIPDSPTRVPPEYAGLVDDAAIFPPAETPLAEAVAAHRRFAAAEHSALVARFVVDDRRLAELTALSADSGSTLAVALTLTGGAGAVEPAVRRMTRTPDSPLALAQLEIALRDLDDLPAAARRVVAATESAEELLGEVPVYVEVPWTVGVTSYGWLGALDVLAEADLRLKLRTGGAADVPVPGSGELAAAVDAALDRELRFKCSGGLHRAVRTAGKSGANHGFLNVLLATAAAWDGASRDDVADLLDRRDEDAVRAAIGEDGTVVAAARRWFTSFGSCSVAEPLADLRRLGLLS
jgi:hypothetical protein